jgi:hypothetical protein
MTDGPFTNWESRLKAHATHATGVERPGALPPFFQFSQNSLQNYADCARRFQLSVIEGLRWPAAESEPIEEHERFVQMGEAFHLLVQRHILGVPADALAPSDAPLANWWDAYLQAPPPDVPDAIRLPEAQLSMPFGPYRLMAKFDLLAIDPGHRAVIVDWKTIRQRPDRDTLARRLQTRVYPLVLAEAGAHLFGGPIRPDDITLIYWFANAPADPAIFRYTATQMADDRATISGLIDDILAADPATIWPLTDDEWHCKYCVYRSLCDRGVRAGSLDDAGSAELDAEVDFGFDLDLGDAGEIAF